MLVKTPTKLDELVDVCKTVQYMIVSPMAFNYSRSGWKSTLSEREKNLKKRVLCRSGSGKTSAASQKDIVFRKNKKKHKKLLCSAKIKKTQKVIVFRRNKKNTKSYCVPQK